MGAVDDTDTWENATDPAGSGADPVHAAGGWPASRSAARVVSSCLIAAARCALLIDAGSC